jgi:bacterioferritin-associated ferredoxin
MYVCICNAVTDKMIRQAAAEGVSTLAELTRYTGCAGSCGSCTDLAEQVLFEARSRRPFGLPVFAVAA